MSEFVVIDGEYQIEKDPDSVIDYRVYWYDWLRGSDRYWTPRAYFSLGETATPPREAQNGKRYRCTRGGRCGSSAPTWATNSTPFSDGGVQWTLIGDEDRIDTITFAAETGITIDSEGKDATETVGLVKLSGGTAGRSYMVTCEIVTDSAQTASQQFRVKVMER